MKALKALWPLLFFLLPAAPASAAIGASDQVIIENVMTMFGLDSGSYEIEVLSNPFKSGTVNAEQMVIKPLTMKEPLGLFTVLATMSNADGGVQTGQVRMRIKKFADVLVAADKIQRQGSFSPEQVTTARMDITNLREQPFVSFEQMTGYRSKRNIARGSIITTEAVEPVPDVDAGGETLIVYNDGLCLITAPGVALQSGVAGDYIKVKNKASKKIIMAKVLDDGSVTVE